MQLSPKQKEIIKLMRKKWEMGYSYPIGDKIKGGAWLQKNGVGRGGNVHYITMPTLKSLLNKHLIYGLDPGFPVIKYGLTELGKTLSI